MQCKPPVFTKIGAKKNWLKKVTVRIKINTRKRSNELFKSNKKLRSPNRFLTQKAEGE